MTLHIASSAVSLLHMVHTSMIGTKCYNVTPQYLYLRTTTPSNARSYGALYIHVLELMKMLQTSRQVLWYLVCPGCSYQFNKE